MGRNFKLVVTKVLSEPRLERGRSISALDSPLKEAKARRCRTSV